MENKEAFTMADVAAYAHLRDVAAAKGNHKRARLADLLIGEILEIIAENWYKAE